MREVLEGIVVCRKCGEPALVQLQVQAILSAEVIDAQGRLATLTRPPYGHVTPEMVEAGLSALAKSPRGGDLSEVDSLLIEEIFVGMLAAIPNRERS